MIHALFVETNGVYFNLEGVEPWDISRDARGYNGPHKVVAHPPCKRWGRYWSGGPNVKIKKLLGDDQGCFSVSLWSVRTFGGVIEHPEASKAWEWYGLSKPPKRGGWVQSDEYGGYTCCVEQGHYGHLARKATWLYFVGGKPKDLIWGASEGKTRLDAGYHTREERLKFRKLEAPTKTLTSSQRMDTPIEFRDLLLELVRR